jgi:molecular chaperone HscA
VHVVQGERELVSDCRSLARFELRGIPPMAAGAARIRVTYQVDADGLLSVSARETRSGVEASITVKPSYGLGDDEVARMLQDSYTRLQVDMVARALREEQVEAERILLATAVGAGDRCRPAGAAERAAIAVLEQGVRDASRARTTRPSAPTSARTRCTMRCRRWRMAPKNSPRGAWTRACARRWPASRWTRYKAYRRSRAGGNPYRASEAR